MGDERIPFLLSQIVNFHSPSFPFARIACYTVWGTTEKCEGVKEEIDRPDIN